MKKSVIIITLSLMAFLFVSCASLTKQSQFPGMYDEKPQVMLIMPPINNSNNVYSTEADFFQKTTGMSEFMEDLQAVFTKEERDFTYLRRLE